MKTATIDDLKNDIFNAQAKLAEVERRFQLAEMEFQNSQSSSTFNAMDDIRLERCGAQYELECAIALMDETIEQMTGGTRDAAQRELSEAVDAWIDADKKFDAAEAALPEDFLGDPESPAAKLWFETMQVATLASEAVDAAQANLDSFTNN